MNNIVAFGFTATATVITAWILLKSLWDYIDGDGTAHLWMAMLAGTLFIVMLTASVMIS